MIFSAENFRWYSLVMKHNNNTVLFVPGPLLTTEEVAKILNISPATLRGWVHEKRIPHRKLGKSIRSAVRFDPVDLNTWYCNTTQSTQSKARARHIEIKTPIPDRTGFSNQEYDSFLKDLKKNKENMN